jgi:pimeloyl-ACP methyl ester carboxylesterase
MRYRTILGALSGAVGVIAAASAPTNAAPVKNIVLVHGAFVDGAGWRAVYNILEGDGFNVSIVQPPLTSLADDVAATERVLALQDGPCILVGHSYGGAIITEAGVDPHVVGLVYIAAHAPDEGETQSSNGKKFPPLGRDAIRTTREGYDYIEPSRFAAEFAADLPADEAGFEARAQMLTAAQAFSTPIHDPAWRRKPSWYMIPQSDHIISPDLERMYAQRAHSHTVEIKGASHSVYRSHPQDVAAMIEDAASHAEDRH